MSEQSKHKNPSTLGRRHLLLVGTGGLAAATLPACEVAEFQFPPPPDAGEDGAAQPPAADSSTLETDSSTPPVDASPHNPSCATNANTLVVPLSKYPQLATVGGTASLSDSRYSDPVCKGQDFYVVQTSAGQYAAFSAWCTHACCVVSISGVTARCPCHGATFNVATGAVTKGPARQPLPSLPVCSDGTNLYITLK